MESTSDARKKRFATVRYHIIRIVLFVSACVCAVAGMLMLSFAGDKQTRAETVASEVARSDAQAQVLLIMSYDDTDVLTPLARNGVVTIMNNSSVAVDIEYMDALHNPKGSEAYEAWSDAMAAKLGKDKNYNAVICADDEALTFVEDHHNDLFANMPVIFFNVNDFEHARKVANTGYATGLLEQSDLQSTMELAKKLRPNASKYLAVVDNTPSGVGERAQFEQAIAALGANAEYLNASELTRDDLSTRLGSVGDDTIVFFLDAFNDVNGNTYSRDESARFVAGATKQPVFGSGAGGVGEGLVGSGFTDPEKDGQRASETCIQVLNGTSPGVIDLKTEGSGGYMFDAEVMGKYGISADALPSDAVVTNQSSFSWDSIKPMLLPVGLMILGVALVLAFAFMGYRRSVQDTREIIAQRNDLRHRFYHDQLTDKFNAQWLNEIVDDEEQMTDVKAVIAVDFVDFSDINDSFGRAAGDRVISEFAERFESLDKEFLVRSMGAEFLIGFNHLIKPGSSDLDKVRHIIEKPVVIDDGEIEVEGHIGIANLEEGMKLKDLVTGVDLAVRNCKKAGIGSTSMFYNERMRREMEDKINITAELKQQIKDESFVVLYQPQVDAKTNEVCGYEALVRLKGNPYYPGQFIPVAEMSGLVIDIDRIVTKKVVQQLATWKKRHKRLAPVSINYSAVQLRDEGYIDFLLDLLKENDVAPSLIKIEITESLLMDDAGKAEDLFARLEREGVLMALDDFGTGYTSLSRVSTIPAQVVKIDKSLVDTYMVPGKEGFLDNLVRLIHGLDKTVIVEGVETLEQLGICRELGCDIVQGYYFSKPLLPEAAAQFKPPAE